MRSASSLRARLLASVFSIGVVAAPMAAAAADTEFNIAPQSLDTALADFSRQSMVPVLATPDITGAMRTSGVVGAVDPQTALGMLLQGTGLTYRREGDTFLIVKADQGPQASGAAAGGAEVEALIVTAQKREEDIQDVPIAISAFTQEDLTRSQVAGGPDLMTQVPNMTFTKTNFTSYSIQIRGVGTQAISATTDPAVAVAFNNTPFIRNRFFEQEFYDLQRVEVLRGPQGTLYGRNATAGVVNVVSAKPAFGFQANASGDVSNYSSRRLEGMINLPLVEDIAALRLAGAWTQRDGYATNEITGEDIDGRDLWSTRLSLRIEPTDAISANLVWEHFEEDDDRLRSGKQLCKKHVVTELGGRPIPFEGSFWTSNGLNYQSGLSQGCERASLYSPESYQTPNGYAVPYYHPLDSIFLPARPGFNPYESTTQSPDLRVIESIIEPEYQAKADIVQLQLSFELPNGLTLASETAYNSDFTFSMQDYNRFNTAAGAWTDDLGTSFYREGVLNDGVFCDPQVGCSDRLVALDLATARSRQFSQEFRLSSDFDSPFNFSLGANYLRYDTEDKYYVFINSLSLFAAVSPYNRLVPLSPYVPGVSDNSECLMDGLALPDLDGAHQVTSCIYMDPNPIGSLNDRGHNYFLSKNPYKLISYAAFGEAYYEVTDNLKVTAGLRWTVDRKEAPRIPSWILGSQSVGYPVAEVVRQEWREPTGRLTVDWKPDLAFTDETLFYASYAHGYKAGGANPPPPGIVVYSAYPEEVAGFQAQSAIHPRTFDPEFVDAYEIGAKNTLLDGRLTANLAAFYYDYENYQISEIVNRSALNRNFDATVWGIELEADWRPFENLRLGFKGGHQRTRLGDGSRAVDLMDRTAGNPDWVVMRPFPTYPSNCTLPTYVLLGDDFIYAPGNPAGGHPGGCEIAYVMGYDPVTILPYVPNPTVDAWPDGRPGRLRFFSDYPGFDPSTAPNNGEGFYKDLSGNELPNAPQYTATVTADYTLPLPNDWLMTLHGDFHWQSKSWWRVFNDHEYGRLKPYTTINLAAIFTNEDAGWNIMAYIKNATDETAITGAFLNSDDTLLTTNVFLTEPRLYGLRVTKAWSGGSTLGGWGARREGPYPFTVELGGQVQRHDAAREAIEPGFSDIIPASLDIFGPAQNDDLDWGDGREVKLTYHPAGSAWSLWAGYRRGETNGYEAPRATENIAPVCGIPDPATCAAMEAMGDKYDILVNTTRPNSSTVFVTNREEHQFVDFAVGRNAGLGRLARSSLNLGLRFARFQSRTDAFLESIPDWDIPEGWLYAEATRHRNDASFLAEREFEGTGPVLSWDASRTLFGDETTGRLELDWSLGGGVLFGKQKTAIAGVENERLYESTGKYTMVFWDRPDEETATPVNIERSKSVTAPMLDLSLGLSYRADRLSVSAGYRWERYFDVLDAGFAEHESFDRTIDGPYFKIAVGFGG